MQWKLLLINLLLIQITGFKSLKVPLFLSLNCLLFLYWLYWRGSVVEIVRLQTHVYVVLPVCCKSRLNAQKPYSHIM